MLLRRAMRTTGGRWRRVGGGGGGELTSAMHGKQSVIVVGIVVAFVHFERSIDQLHIAARLLAAAAGAGAAYDVAATAMRGNVSGRGRSSVR